MTINTDDFEVLDKLAELGERIAGAIAVLESTGIRREFAEAIIAEQLGIKTVFHAIPTHEHE